MAPEAGVPPGEPSVVRVATGSGGYEVRIGAGLLDHLAELAAGVVGARRWAILTDETVGRLHGAAAIASFERAGFAADLVAFSPGEASKTRATWAALCDALGERGFGRDCAIVALGGGVVGDVAGFVAATWMRGVPLVHVPTTLLAMVDASVGGKTGIDVPAGKNLVGAFKWPAVVVADPAVLRTLPDDVFRAGMAEAVKHGVVADGAHLDWLVARADALLAQDAASLGALVRRSVEIKAAVVSEDPLESGRRAILNFGHTVAHGIERASDYTVDHGRAVAMGMVAEAFVGERLGITKRESARTLARALARFDLPVAVPDDLAPARVLEYARHDKKNRASRIRCALIAGVGEAARNAGGDWTFAISGEELLYGIAAGRDASNTR